MSRDYTTNGFVELVKIRAGIPVLQELFPASALLLLGTTVIEDTVIPMIRTYKKQHFRTSADQTTTTARTYAIPVKAMDRGLVNVTMVPTSGAEYPLDPIDFDSEIDAFPRGASLQSSGDRPQKYYVHGDRVSLWPSSRAGDTLRLHFEALPNRLCRSAAYTYNSGSEAAEAGLITSINTGTGVITCSGGVPSTISTATPICAISSTPGFAELFTAVTPSGKSATTVTVSTANASLVSVGDWICLDGDSPIVQLPIEAIGIAAQGTVCAVFESLGHRGRLEDARSKLGDIMKNYILSHPQRVTEAPEHVEPTESISDWMELF